MELNRKESELNKNLEQMNLGDRFRLYFLMQSQISLMRNKKIPVSTHLFNSQSENEKRLFKE